jgi:hypothetical protein
MSIILTAQTPPTGGGLQFEQTVDTAPPGSTTPADTVPFATIASTKWLVTVSDTTRVRFFEIAAVCTATTEPRYNLFGDIGDRINVTPVVSKLAGEIILSIINNEASDIDVNIARIHSFAK